MFPFLWSWNRAIQFSFPNVHLSCSVLNLLFPIYIIQLLPLLLQSPFHQGQIIWSTHCFHFLRPHSHLIPFPSTETVASWDTHDWHIFWSYLNSEALDTIHLALPGPALVSKKVDICGYPFTSWGSPLSFKLITLFPSLFGYFFFGIRFWSIKLFHSHLSIHSQSPLNMYS